MITTAQAYQRFRTIQADQFLDADGVAIGGATDHGALTGLADDDHAQYALADGSRGAFAATSHTHAPSAITQGGANSGDVLAWSGSAWAPVAPSAGVTDHGALTGLSDDDHSIYGLLAGRSGGQTLIGGTGSGQNLTLQSTSNATRGRLLTDPITVTSPAAASIGLIVKGAGSQSGNLLEAQNSSGTILASILAAGSFIGPTGSAGGTKTLGAQSCTTAIYLTSSHYGILGDNNSAAYLEWGPGIGGVGLRTPRGILMGSVGGGIVPCTITGASSQAVSVLTLTGGSSQTGPLLRTENSSNVIQFAVGIGGKLLTNQAVANTNTPTGATVQAMPFYNVAGTLLGYAPLYAAPW